MWVYKPALLSTLGIHGTFGKNQLIRLKQGHQGNIPRKQLQRRPESLL